MKTNKFIIQTFFLFFISLSAGSVFSYTKTNMTPIWKTHPFYVGVELGWGCTDWSQLVAQGFSRMETDTLSTSTPIQAGDTGFVYGLMAGYEISTYFAMETNYMRFPNTSVRFDRFSVYASEHGVTLMDSRTYIYNIVGKFMVPIAHTHWRGFANAGAALTHRGDPLVSAAHIVPTFGVGVNYVFHLRYFLEFAFQYYAGFGKATFRPALDYIPFLYTVHAKIGFRF